MNQDVASALVYAVAGAGVIATTYAAQPAMCVKLSYWPYVLPMLLVLCLIAAMAQRFARLGRLAKPLLALVFAVGIQGTVLVPCVSDIHDSRVLTLSAVGLGLVLMAALSLIALAVGLVHAGIPRLGRLTLSFGLVTVAIALVLGVGRQFLGVRGAEVWSSFAEAVAELRVPTALSFGVAVAVAGVMACIVQERRYRSTLAVR
jgi:hypothetical protein